MWEKGRYQAGLHTRGTLIQNIQPQNTTQLLPGTPGGSLSFRKLLVAMHRATSVLMLGSHLSPGEVLSATPAGAPAGRRAKSKPCTKEEVGSEGFEPAQAG